MKAKNTISHRERKNGSMREKWEKRKAARNASKVVVHLDRPWPLNGREGYSPESIKP